MACLGPLLGSHKGMEKVSASAEVSLHRKRVCLFFPSWQNSDPTTVILNVFYQLLPRARAALSSLPHRQPTTEQLASAKPAGVRKTGAAMLCNAIIHM